MTLRWGAVVLLMLVGTGCATSRVVRLDTGERRPIIYTPRVDAEPVELDEDEFAEVVQKMARTAPPSTRPRDAALRLFGLDVPRAYSPVRGRLGLVSIEDPRRGRLLVTEKPNAEAELASAYGRWCLRLKEPRDCLHLLDGDVILDVVGLHQPGWPVVTQVPGTVRPGRHVTQCCGQQGPRAGPQRASPAEVS